MKTTIKVLGNVKDSFILDEECEIDFNIGEAKLYSIEITENDVTVTLSRGEYKIYRTTGDSGSIIFPVKHGIIRKFMGYHAFKDITLKKEFK